jgi:phosphatidylserine/phosphatidylglycerophosphate/cardiolipin synthase-like enzyme
MNRTSRSVSLVLALAVTLVTLAPAAGAWEPRGGATFNNPKGSSAARWKIVHAVDKAVRQARRGSRIMISTYLMDSGSSANALLGARRRGVRVQIVMDGDVRTRHARRLARVFNRDNRPKLDGVDKKDGIPLKWGRDKSFVVFCDGACRGGPSNNHSKFYVFTKTGTASNVSMVSSSNLNSGGAQRGWNDLYTIKNRLSVVKHYAVVHAEMAEDARRGRYRQYVDGPFITRFYPKSTPGDPVIADMAKIRCHGARGGAGRGGRTAINVSMFAWNSTRGMATARRLVQLDRNGCDVSVIYGAPSRKVRDFLMASARRGGIKLWDSRFDRNDDGLFDLRVHHKYLLINGVYGGDKSSWRVHTGSQNWGRGTLRNGDENTLNVRSRPAYKQYMANWNQIARNASRRIVRVDARLLRYAEWYGSNVGS